MKRLFSCATAVAVVAFFVACASQSGRQDASTTAMSWWKGNLHTHSLWSDGNDYPESIVHWYRERGYHFLALSDHNIFQDHERFVPVDRATKRGAKGALERLREIVGDAVVTRTRDGIEEIRLARFDELQRRFDDPGRFLLIAGEEITDSAFGRFPVHINATNIAEKIEPKHGKDVREVMRRNLRAVMEQAERLDRPIIAHLNHPNFGYAITAEEIADVVEDRFFEIFNGHTGVHQLGDEDHATVERIWDVALTLRHVAGAVPLYGIATDDSHHYFGGKVSTPGRGWVQVRASRLRTGELLASMERGDFYASTGVELRDVGFDGRELVVAIRAEDGVQYETHFVGTRRGVPVTGELVRDEAGNPVRTTKRYSPDIGTILARASGDVVRYRLTGDERYVRAIVISSKLHPDPSFDGQFEQAWTQPVGWSN